jgi:hypothetical protein
MDLDMREFPILGEWRPSFAELCREVFKLKQEVHDKGTELKEMKFDFYRFVRTHFACSTDFSDYPALENAINSRPNNHAADAANQIAKKRGATNQTAEKGAVANQQAPLVETADVYKQSTNQHDVYIQSTNQGDVDIQTTNQRAATEDATNQQTPKSYGPSATFLNNQIEPFEADWTKVVNNGRRKKQGGKNLWAENQQQRPSVNYRNSGERNSHKLGNNSGDRNHRSGGKHTYRGGQNFNQGGHNHRSGGPNLHNADQTSPKSDQNHRKGGGSPASSSQQSHGQRGQGQLHHHVLRDAKKKWDELPPHIENDEEYNSFRAEVEIIEENGIKRPAGAKCRIEWREADVLRLGFPFVGHAIGQDRHMGRGAALHIKNINGEVHLPYGVDGEPGCVIPVTMDKKQFPRTTLLHTVCKKRSSERLQDTKGKFIKSYRSGYKGIANWCSNNGVKQLAITPMGCRTDGLPDHWMEQQLWNAFADQNIHIVICNFNRPGQNRRDPPQQNLDTRNSPTRVLKDSERQLVNGDDDYHLRPRNNAGFA